MKNRIHWPAVVGLILTGAVLLFAGAASTQARNYRYFKPKKAKAPVPTMVQAVDTNANTIVVLDGKETTTYTVDKLTAITVNGAPGKLSDVTKGMTVTVTAATQGRAGKIEAETGPDKPAAKSKKK